MEEILASIRRIISEDEPADGAKAAESDAPESDDVLELTDVAEDEPEAAEEAVEDSEEEISEADAPPEEDPVEEEIDFDAPVESAEDDLELREEAEIEDELPEEPAEPIAVAPAQPVETVQPAQPAESALLGVEPAGSATSSLASLVQAVDRAHGGTPLGDANRTIEDLVKEVMRPMIREWLDENLPGLVDRLVRREIERLSRTAEGDD